MDLKQELGKNLTQLLKVHGISKQDLANAIGISRPSISQFASGKSMPGIETLVDISKHFNVSMDYLLGKERRFHADKDQNIKVVFSKNLMALMEQKKIKQQELATELGLSRSAIALFVAAKNIPTAENLLNISRFFNVSVDYLLNSTEDYSEQLPVLPVEVAAIEKSIVKIEELQTAMQLALTELKANLAIE